MADDPRYYGNGTPLQRPTNNVSHSSQKPTMNGQLPQSNKLPPAKSQQLPNPLQPNFHNNIGAGDAPYQSYPYHPTSHLQPAITGQPRPGVSIRPPQNGPTSVPSPQIPGAIQGSPLRTPPHLLGSSVNPQPSQVPPPPQMLGSISGHLQSPQMRAPPPQRRGNGSGPQIRPLPLSGNQTRPPGDAGILRPTMPQHQYVNQQLAPAMEKMSVAQHGFNRLWGMETVDLLQYPNIVPPGKVAHPPIRLTHEFMNNINCDQDIFCCTMNKVPETNNLLQKSRLPLGVLIHPFRDLSDLSVVQSNTIVRCRACRTYINPFVYFVDNKRWKCNLCFRVNELPDDFQYDPISKTYGDPSRRPEVRNCTIEFIAPSEYMLRPPQPAIYLYLLDVSRWACDCGYLRTLCETLLEELDNIPGDARTQLGFILYDSSLHFLSIVDGASQARELVVTDIDDVFLPTPDSLLVNLQENRQVVVELLEELPIRYRESWDDGSAMGAALQAAHKLLGPTGGRVTVFQGCLPNRGPGSLRTREGASDTARDSSKLGPQTDFYKRLALECSTQQIAVDLFLVAAHHADLATLAGMSQFSGGCIHQFVHYRADRVECRERLTRCLRRYLTRKIGFEAVMRVRCSRGLAIHTFHGNFFVRSTDLLSLPNVNPDAGFGLQVAIEDSLSDLGSVCFQAALLYTSSKGERRIRVHTLCLPVGNTLSDILASANQKAIVGLLAKMAVDRSLKDSVSDAREAFMNAAVDILSAYKLAESRGSGGLLAPTNLALIPLYILALLKSIAFRPAPVPRLDDRVFAMLQMKTLPLQDLIQLIHHDLYNITYLNQQPDTTELPPRLGLSAQFIDSRNVYLLDAFDIIYIIVGDHVLEDQLADILGKEAVTAAVNDDIIELADDAPPRLIEFLTTLQHQKSYPAVLRILRSPSQWAYMLVNDKTESSFSYHEILNHIHNQVK